MLPLIYAPFLALGEFNFFCLMYLLTQFSCSASCWLGRLLMMLIWLDKAKFYGVGVGLFSGITVALYPVSVTKTRLQVASKNVAEQNAFSVIRGILKANGIPGLYRGFGTVIVGAIPSRIIWYYSD